MLSTTEARPTTGLGSGIPFVGAQVTPGSALTVAVLRPLYATLVAGGRRANPWDAASTALLRARKAWVNVRPP